MVKPARDNVPVSLTVSHHYRHILRSQVVALNIAMQLDGGILDQPYQATS